MARELDVPLYEFCFAGPRITRHLKALSATLRLLFRDRPAVVFASNPSLVLTCLLLAFRPLLHFRFVSDAHYGGVVSVTGSRLLQRALDFANRRADLVIVTNEGHADRVRSIGGMPFVCPDPLPHLPPVAPRPEPMLAAEKAVLFICSFDRDEPYSEMFEAAQTLAPHGFKVFASGSYTRAALEPETVPHVTLLGYVDRETYEAYLQNADVIVDLTTWQDCLVCGAYEAMAAGKPCVLSRTPALTDLFTHGTVFSSHTPADIVEAIRSAYEHRDLLRSQIAEWVVRHQAATKARRAALRAAAGLLPLA